MYLSANFHTSTVLYKEYQTLKSKVHVGGSKSSFGTDSKNSVFGAHLNKQKSSTGRKALFCSVNSTTLDRSKFHGWTTSQNINKSSNNECRDVNEVCYIIIIDHYV